MNDMEDLLGMVFEGLPLLIIFGFLWLAFIVLVAPFIGVKRLFVKLYTPKVQLRR